ncbi:hypothetical protein ANTRET_LOCUS7005 [Anthophora retusa]
MENEKLHFRYIMLYEFRKGVSVGITTKHIQDVYLDRAPALRIVKNWFGRFWKGDFNLDTISLALDDFPVLTTILFVP